MGIVFGFVFITMLVISYLNPKTLLGRHFSDSPPNAVEDAKKKAAEKIKLPKTEAFKKILIF